MRALKRSEVLEAKDIVVEEVPTPEFGPDTCIRIRNLTAIGRGAFIRRSIEARKVAEGEGEAVEVKPEGEFDLEVLLVAMSAVDENDQPLFTEEDVKVLGQKNAATISRLAEVAQKLSGLTAKAQEKVVKS